MKFTLDLSWLYFSKEFFIVNYDILNVHIRDCKDGDTRVRMFCGNADLKYLVKRLGSRNYVYEAICKSCYGKPEEVNVDPQKIRNLFQYGV